MSHSNVVIGENNTVIAHGQKESPVFVAEIPTAMALSVRPMGNSAGTVGR